MKNDQIIPELERITIGRLDSNRIKLAPTNIGRYHAVITVIGSNVYLLEDLDSKHGTFVNAERIHRKFISGEDKISFATNHYEALEILEMAKVIKPSLKSKDDNDYTEEFMGLREFYNQYETFKKQERQIRAGIKKMNENLRIGGAFATTTAGIAAFFAQQSITAAIAGGTLTAAAAATAPVTFIPMLAACGLGMLIPAIGSKFLGEREKLDQPMLYYENNWKCPKCNDFFGLNKSWETLAKQKKCNKCGAIWVK